MSDNTDLVKKRSARHIAGTITSFIGAQVLMAWILIGPLADQPWLQGFRGYFPNDQLSYSAIATTIAGGTFAPLEPLTETGVSYYPSAWYYLIGLASLVTGSPVWTLWQILGLVAIASGIAALGFLGYSLTRIPITPLLPAAALATGTFSTYYAGEWSTYLGYHAVIWGAFGTLFTLNAEAIGIVAVAVLFTWAVITIMRRPGGSPVTFTLVAALLGLLANVQTYSFLTGTSLAVAFITSYSLVTMPSKRRLVATLASVAAVLLLGRFIADLIGPLPLFGLLLLATLPALWPLIRRNAGSAISVTVAFAVAASPQVLRTAYGLVTGDDFLGYRQASSEDLGIAVGPILISGLVLIALASVVFLSAVAVPRTRQANAVIAAVSAVAVGIVIMTTNDLWGFNQEPYRFWLQYSIVGLLALSTLLPWVWIRQREVSAQVRRGTLLLSLATAILWTVSLADVVAFRDFARSQGVIAAEDDFARAHRNLVGPESGLVLSSRCLDTQQLRLVTRAPVAHFNRGLAWPSKKDLLDQVMDHRVEGVSDYTAVAQAGVTYVITDSSCIDDWDFQDARVQPDAIEPYSRGTLTRWRVAPLT